MDLLGKLAWEIVVTAFFCIPIGLSLWALLDCAKRPGWAWGLSRRSRLVWMAAILLGILSLVPGLIISSWYLLRIRPEIAGIEDGRLPDLPDLAA